MDRNNLIHKLQSVGIKNNVLKWVASNLQNSEQCTNVNSSTKATPQGSILGAGLFIM